MLQIRIPNIASLPVQRRLARAVQNQGPGLLLAGRFVRNLLIGHFREKNASEPNKMAGKRTNLWATIGRSVTAPKAQGNNAVTVGITHPAFAQKLLGGEITPKRKKYLTIPANPLAYGKPAASFNLKFSMEQNPAANWHWMPALILATSMDKAKRWKSQKREGGKTVKIKQKVQYDYGRVMFWLVKRVNQRPWPGALPEDSALETQAVEGFQSWLNGILAAKGGA